MDRRPRLGLLRKLGAARPRLSRLLVANRGEIALRLLRAASDLDIATVAIFTPQDAASLHVSAAESAVEVPSYFDAQAILSAAVSNRCDSLHPGYGFLSESAGFARQCELAGLVFVGPTPDTIDQLGDKYNARRIAKSLGIPVPKGSRRTCPSATEVRNVMFFEQIGWPVMLKVTGGGGGRGIRPVHHDSELDDAFAACVREGGASCGDGEVFVEQLIPRARHLEIQVLGDGAGEVVHLFERDCSVQRRRQKMVEVAPAVGLDPSIRDEMVAHALALARHCGYRSAGTFEFLLPEGKGARPLFLECNPRIQVEHTVSEEATGVDLVRAQLQIAAGCSLSSIGLSQSSIQLHSAAIQARISMSKPGRVLAYAEPGGIGVRVESALYAGYTPPTDYDPLLLKIVAHARLVDFDPGGFETARRRLLRACAELHVAGSVRTNVNEIRSVLDAPSFCRGEWVTERLDQEKKVGIAPTDSTAQEGGVRSRAQLLERALACIGASDDIDNPAEANADEEGCAWVRAPMRGVVVAGSLAEVGTVVGAGGRVAIIEALKMEFELTTAVEGVVDEVSVAEGAEVADGERVVRLRTSPTDLQGAQQGVGSSTRAVDNSIPRPDLARMLERRRATTDEGRLEADRARFAKRLEARRAKGQRSARENLAALVDEGSFLEYGRFALPAQLQRYSLDELISRAPADGIVVGVAAVNGAIFSAPRAAACVMAYDATVLAGTQGFYNHQKLDRMLAQAHSRCLPVVLMAEGGGGRPGETDVQSLQNSWLTCPSFTTMASLSGLVPLVGLTSGFCFAGNAALLGLCDVVICTQGANVGMAGPAMIEGGGLGKVHPNQIGPAVEQARNGVVDILVQDEEEAVRVARQYLSFFQGSLPPPPGGFEAADQLLLRTAVPENRKRAYEMRTVIKTVCDAGSFLEMRREFAPAVICGLFRVKGRSVGVVANNPWHLGGAIDADGALKASRFMELCDAFDVPLLFLCDTPGFMVGPEHERQAAVRKLCRMFAVGASLTVPFFTIVTRKSYGLGAQAMSGGAAVGRNAFHVSWPTAEAGPMNVEGAVELGFSKELAEAEAESAQARQDLFSKLAKAAYEGGGALNVARTLETDDVIDPSESRAWIASVVEAHQPPHFASRRAKKRPCINPW